MKRIVSGGQTGVDRAALDAALDSGFECGGWCPKGRKAEDGVIPDIYPLRETATDSYLERTEQNVIDSTASVIFYYRNLGGGTKRTRDFAVAHNRPFLLFDLSRTKPEDACHQLAEFVRINNIESLNVAGPRASKQKDIYSHAYSVIHCLLKSIAASQRC